MEAQLEEETKQNMRNLVNYNAEYEAKEVQLAELVRRIDEMKESHVFEVRGLTAGSEYLKKQGEVKEAEYAAARREWQMAMTESCDNLEKMLAGRLCSV